MAQEVGFIEVFPPRAAGSRPPVLLQTLEAQLLEATNTASRAASAGPHQIRDPQLAANLALDCHRKVFQSFIDGFGVYGPLLSQIKRVFNRAIEDGLKDGLENSELRQQLLEVRREQAAAEAAGRAEVIDGQQPLREELYHAIAAMQARLSAAERRRNLAAKDLNRSKQELERIRGLAKAGKATKQRLVDSAAAEAEWLTKPGASGIIAMTAGPLTRLEDDELEAEMGVVTEDMTPKHPLEHALQLLEKHDAAAAARFLEEHTGSSSGGTASQQQQQPLKQPHAGQQIEQQLQQLSTHATGNA